MSDVKGMGIDLCGVSRMAELLDSGRPLRRMFTEAEEAYIRGRGAVAAQSAAGLYAAKEAALKSLGTGLSIPLTDIEITHTELGQPRAALHGKAAAMGGRLEVSITHEDDMAAAVALWMA